LKKKGSEENIYVFKSPQNSAERGKRQKNVNWWTRQLLSHTHDKYLYTQSVQFNK